MRVLSAYAETISTSRRYFDVEIDGERLEDVVWYDLYPMQERAAIVGKLCSEVGRPGVSVRVDGIELNK